MQLDTRREYDRCGHVVVRGAVPAEACARMRDALWSGLARAHGIRREAPETWKRGPVFGLQAVRKAGAFAGLASPAFGEAVDGLLGAGTWDPPAHWGEPLVSFPTEGPWELPAERWHLDFPVRGRLGPRFAVKAIALLDTLESGGGGTLLLEGSHHLVARRAEAAPGGDAGHSRDVRARLAREHAWLRALVAGEGGDRVSRFMEEGAELEGVRLRVVEFTGEAGDVLFFHPWLFHNASPNCGTRPRLALGQTLPTREGLRIYAPPG